MTDALAPSPGIALTREQKLAWLRLIRSENVGPATFRDLINHFGTASAAIEGLPEIAARGRGRKRLVVASEQDARNELDRLEHMGGQLVCLGEPNYPASLRATEAPPPVLSVLGKKEILTHDVVAFVGSRNASLAGVKFTKILASDVAKADYVTISGLARGIDSAAHEATLQSGTIAVFAGGVDHIYPRENQRLSAAILENGGAIISEMPLGWQPRAQDFPRRNRIVAGISLGLVVVEAARRSGSLISARLANESGRLVFAVPGSPLDPRSEGANHLIREGAILVRDAEDIISALKPMTIEQEQHGYSLSDDDSEYDETVEPTQSDRERLMSALDLTPVDIDELIRFTGIEAKQMQILLLELDLSGQLERHSGNRVSLQ